MSLVAIGLFVLACGWNVYRLFLPTRAAALRNEGHPQYFGAALAAGYIAFLAIFLHAAAGNLGWYAPTLSKLVQLAPQADKEPGERGDANGTISPVVYSPVQIQRLIVQGQSRSISQPAPMPQGPVSKPEKMPTKPDPYPTVLAVGLWASLMALLLPSILNAPFRHNARLRLLAGRKSFNDVEQILVDALERGSSIAITLTTGKVYIGIPNEFDPNGDEADWVSVWPLASGYRTRKGNLRLTTAYEEAYGRITSEKNFGLTPDDFKITLPLPHIASIQAFNLQLFIRQFARYAGEEETELADALGENALSEGPFEDDAVSVEDVTDALSEFDGKPVADGTLTALKWTFHVAFTAAIVVLPFSLWTAIALALLCIGIFYILKDPERELAYLLEAARDA